MNELIWINDDSMCKNCNALTLSFDVILEVICDDNLLAPLLKNVAVNFQSLVSLRQSGQWSVGVFQNVCATNLGQLGRCIRLVHCDMASAFYTLYLLSLKPINKRGFRGIISRQV